MDSCTDGTVWSKARIEQQKYIKGENHSLDTLTPSLLKQPKLIMQLSFATLSAAVLVAANSVSALDYYVFASGVECQGMCLAHSL